MNVGDKAPEVLGVNEKGERILLSNYRGKKVVLYFYPKDNTKGCTTQACTFRDAYSEFEALGAVVIGVSKDSTRSHTNFASKYELPFLLLSDPETEVIQAYDVWKEKKMYGKTYMGIVRTTYIIDEAGMIEKVYEKVKPAENADQILEHLKGEA